MNMCLVETFSVLLENNLSHILLSEASSEVYPIYLTDTLKRYMTIHVTH